MNQVAFKSLNSALQVGVFEERFPKRVLYIKDSSPNKRTWNGIFHADLSNSEKPIITLAKRGHLINDFQNKKLILNLSHGASYETIPQAKGAAAAGPWEEAAAAGARGGRPRGPARGPGRGRSRGRAGGRAVGCADGRADGMPLGPADGMKRIPQADQASDCSSFKH